MNQAPQTLTRSGPRVIVFLAVLLLILHQDYWFWTNQTLVFGILPIGLFWHICISLAAVLTWYLATRIAWPLDVPGEAVIATASAREPSRGAAAGKAEEARD